MIFYTSNVLLLSGMRMGKPKRFNVGDLILKEVSTYLILEKFKEYKPTYSIIKYKIECSSCTEAGYDRSFVTTRKVLLNPKSYSCPCSKSFEGYTIEDYRNKVRKLYSNLTLTFYSEQVNQHSCLSVFCKDCEESYKTNLNILLSDRFKCNCTLLNKPYNIDKEISVIKACCVDTGYKLIKYNSTTGKVKYDYFLYHCNKGHSNYNTITNFRDRGSKLYCRLCNTHKRRTKLEAQEELLTYVSEQGYKFLKWENSKDNFTIYDKFLWKCWCGYENSTSFDNFLRGRGCKSCSGKIKNYQGTGYLYLAEWLTTKGKVIKVGITKVRDPVRRVKEFKKNDICLKLCRYEIIPWENYWDIKCLESYVKGVFNEFITESKNSYSCYGHTEVITCVPFEIIRDTIKYYETLMKKEILNG